MRLNGLTAPLLMFSLGLAGALTGNVALALHQGETTSLLTLIFTSCFIGGLGVHLHASDTRR